MSLPGFKAALLAEIEHQKETSQRMGDYNPEWDNGIMYHIRAERFRLLEELLTYEPSDATEQPK